MILGGITGVDDWYPHASPETTEDIISRTLAIAPEIAPPESRSNGRIPTIDDVKSIMIEAGCGLRPGRKGGIRLDVGKVDWFEENTSRSTPLVFNYGYVHLFTTSHSLFGRRVVHTPANSSLTDTADMVISLLGDLHAWLWTCLKRP